MKSYVIEDRYSIAPPRMVELMFHWYDQCGSNIEVIKVVDKEDRTPKCTMKMELLDDGQSVRNV